MIESLKDAFARHGIPTEVVSDNGPQFKSRYFNKFAKDWEFKHTTSSPHYPRSNGLAESSVKTVKRMMKKCFREKEDIKRDYLYFETHRSAMEKAQPRCSWDDNYKKFYFYTTTLVRAENVTLSVRDSHRKSTMTITTQLPHRKLSKRTRMS